ncbi:hypothetical protein UJ101_01350 [Flavobacteriaceae bacterium UJ101]|nr:hypothetical protein UJ101_01350 [Flavobacteriaceae bacterium UJ101]
MKSILLLRHYKTIIDEKVPSSLWTLESNYLNKMPSFSKQADIIYTSPEPKALITAKLISERFKIDYIIEPKLSEISRDQGGFVKNYNDTVKQYFQEKDRFDNKYMWEDYLSAEKRIYHFLKDLSDKKHNYPLIISHGMLISILYSQIKKVDTYRFWEELNFGEELIISNREFLVYLKGL